MRKRGLFYMVAGREVEAIDGPTWNRCRRTTPHAKPRPRRPGRRRRAICRPPLSARPPAARSTFAVIDASDLAVTILGASQGADRELIATLMRDNPLGQGHEQTPVCVLRPLGPLPSQS